MASSSHSLRPVESLSGAPAIPHRRFPFLLTALFSILLVLPSFPALALDCDMCRARISGNYLHFDRQGAPGVDVCQTCAQRSARCALCTIPVRGTAPRNGAVLCHQCRRDAQWCDLCRNVISGKYTNYRSATGQETQVCSDCKTSKPACASCGIPHNADDLTLRSGKAFCGQCLALTHFCDLCTQPISGSIHGFQNIPGEWCETCFTAMPRCDSCLVPMDSTAATTLPDGRLHCARCSGNALAGETMYGEIAKSLAQDFQSLLGKPLSLPQIRAVSQQELDAAMAGADPSMTGLANDDPDRTVHNMGLFRVRTFGQREILIVDRLTEDSAWETIAHEMAHAWQHQHYPRLSDPFLSEGFAQWMAEELCYRHGRRSGLDRLRRRSDFYGVAYRVVAQIEAQGGGPQAVLNALASGKIPEGVEDQTAGVTLPSAGRSLLPWR
ncbi:MAG: hypothetical protein RLY93_20855 [Sumerlaeia bacterium]